MVSGREEAKVDYIHEHPPGDSDRGGDDNDVTALGDGGVGDTAVDPLECHEGWHDLISD